MRTLTELYKVVLAHYTKCEKEKDYKQYICVVIDTLDATLDEKNILREHFISQKPSKKLHSEFTEIYVDDIKMFSGGYAWWILADEYTRDGFIIRMNFIVSKVKTICFLRVIFVVNVIKLY